MEKKYFRLIIILSFLFLIIRLPFLDQLFLLHDERDIVLSGYSIARTGRDLFGNLLPLSFNGISPNNPLVAIYYSAIWSFINPVKSVFYARLPFVLVSTLLIFLVYRLIMELTKDNKKAVLTAVFFCFSPWVFHLTRLAMDIGLAIILLISAMIFYLRRKIFIAYLLFFLTFYTYQGFRLLIPFLIVYLELYFYLQKKDIPSFLRKTGLNIVFIFLLIVSTLFIDAGITQNRLEEIIFFNKEKTSADVIFQRLTTVAPGKLPVIFSNKLTVAGDYILTNFVKGQDLFYLFKEGDYSAINGNTASGQFFLVFMILYYLGIASFGKKVSKEDLYIIGLIIVGMIPSLLSVKGASFSIRAMLSGVGYAYLMSSGVLFSFALLQKIKYKKPVIAGFAVLLFINIVYFSYTYYFRRPVTVGELFNENERQLTKYLQENNNKSLTVYHSAPQNIYFSVLFLDNANRASGYKYVQCKHTMNFKKLKQAIIEERCLSPELYDYFNDLTNKKVAERIKYRDYSTRTAYFVTE